MTEDDVRRIVREEIGHVVEFVKWMMDGSEGTLNDATQEALTRLFPS